MVDSAVVGQYTGSQTKLRLVVIGCLAMTIVAFSTDDDAGWMLGTGVVLGSLILMAARERWVADYLRRWPAGSRLCVVLLAMAVASGFLDVPAQELVGLLGTTVLIYLVVVLLAVWNPIRRR